jgi:predicted DNA-binding transcriptional regulator AlpA
MPNYITKKELMSLLRISSTTLERWLKEEKLPKPIQISRVRLWEKDEILRTMEAFKAQNA